MTKDELKLVLEALKDDMTERETLKMALGTLEAIATSEQARDLVNSTIAAIRRVLAQCPDCGKAVGDAGHIHTCSPQPKQKPVAWVLNRELFWPSEYEVISQNGDNAIPLYTTPPQRKPLTDDEAIKIVQGVVSTSVRPIGAVALGLLVLRASEAVHGIT